MDVVDDDVMFVCDCDSESALTVDSGMKWNSRNNSTATSTSSL